ncbi:MAG: helix-turn-helix domain-containing protein, partial [Desulfohalobiaceae bacterium]
MSLMDIGQTLKKERKRQQLSLEDVYATTKIGMDILRGIEEADLDQMPHLVYARGFIRNYADFLGLSGEDMVQAFDEAMEEEAGQASHRERGSGLRRSAEKKGGEKSGNKLSVGLVL